MVLLLVALAVSPATSLASEVPIEISGFGDVLYLMQRGKGDKESYGIGQVEVDLNASLNESVLTTVAIAYDPDLGEFSLGAFTLDYHLFGSDGDHFRRGGMIDHSGLLAGQFDIPFGIDWRVYPSIDRKLVSTPLVVAGTHDCWNDLGFQGYLGTEWFNAAAYATNGWDHDASSLVPSDKQSVSIDQTEVIAESALGGRLGLLPYEALEVGGSYAHVQGRDDGTSMSLTGADLQFNAGRLSIKGEYIAHTISVTAGSELTSAGFYAQGLYDLDRLFVVGRYGSFSPDSDDAEEQRRFSAGVGWRIIEGSEIRFEYQANGESVEDAALLQLVVGY